MNSRYDTNVRTLCNVQKKRFDCSINDLVQTMKGSTGFTLAMFLVKICITWTVAISALAY
jgi:hypothetical protein